MFWDGKLYIACLSMITLKCNNSALFAVFFYADCGIGIGCILYYAGLGIRSFAHRSFAHFAEIK